MLIPYLHFKCEFKCQYFIISGAANRLINADGSLPYKIIEENMVPTNRGEYVKRMRQNQEPTFTTNANESSSAGSSYNSRQTSIYSNISDLSRSTSINSSNSLTTNSSGSFPNHITNADDDSFVSRIMGSLEVCMINQSKIVHNTRIIFILSA